MDAAIATVAGPFAPGEPDPAHVIPIELGSTLPALDLVDQNGALLRLDRAFAGKTVLVTFIFTRCPDRTLCPAISGKFAYMQARLDPKRFALVEITLDPPYDSPPVSATVWRAVRRRARDRGRCSPGRDRPSSTRSMTFRINSLRGVRRIPPRRQALHRLPARPRRLRRGYGATGIRTACSPKRAPFRGLASNPFERFKLSLVANVVALCGGSQFAGIVLLELALFVFITAIVTGAYGWSPGCSGAKSRPDNSRAAPIGRAPAQSA